MPSKISDYAYAENRNLTEIHIPDGTTCIGRHAFYNCRSLHTVILPHGGIEIEDGAFKNCPKLSHIILSHGDGDCTCLKDILYDMYQEVTVSVTYDNGSQAVLFFPRYEYEYIANEPARIFQEVGYGAGYLYQQCFYDSKLDYRRYDDLWSRARVSEDISVLARILSCRLRFPRELSSDAEAAYLDFWNDHQAELLTYFIKEQDTETLHYFLKGENAGSSLMLFARDTARLLEIPSMVSYVLDLEQQRKKSEGHLHKFDL